MNFTIHTEFTFDSAHLLKNYNGKCKNLHGHTWFVEVWAKGKKLNKLGILFDFGEVKTIKEQLDHNYLNEKLNFNPTAENLTKYIYTSLKQKYKHLKFKVRLYETKVGKETWCEYGDFE